MFEKSQIFVKSRNNLQHEQCDSIQDEDELREDAFGLLERYDDMSVEDINRFTRDDIVCALEMFNEDYVTLSEGRYCQALRHDYAGQQEKLAQKKRSCSGYEYYEISEKTIRRSCKPAKKSSPN